MEIIGFQSLCLFFFLRVKSIIFFFALVELMRFSSPSKAAINLLAVRFAVMKF